MAALVKSGGAGWRWESYEIYASIEPLAAKKILPPSRPTSWRGSCWLARQQG